MFPLERYRNKEGEIEYDRWRENVKEICKKYARLGFQLLLVNF